MSETIRSAESGAVSRLLAETARIVEAIPYCWLMTTTAGGTATARPMGRLPRAAGEAAWTFRFVTGGQSRKAAALRRDGRASLVFQQAPSDAYIALIGTTVLRTDETEVRRRWKPAYDIYFPTAEARANAAFLEFEARRMELWIRGVTPEPFGLLPTPLERGPDDLWRLADA